jgi:hypothetical protein
LPIFFTAGSFQNCPLATAALVKSFPIYKKLSYKKILGFPEAELQNLSFFLIKILSFSIQSLVFWLEKPISSPY